MERAPLAFVSLPSVAGGHPLACLLQRHGYRLVDVSAAALLAEDAPASPHPLILVVNHLQSEIEPLRAAIRRQRSAVLGVLSEATVGCCSDLTRDLTDFVSWPCREQELLWRIDRLTSAPPPPSPLEPTLRDSLLRLNLVGESPRFLAALQAIVGVARTQAPVLIEGETGTGKELAAHAVHYLGARRDAPFIPINCGAIPDTLLESELFGHMRGAFTDARDMLPGLVALAEGGTLFLDEIDALSQKAQVALLRFLQDRQYRPLGGKAFRTADVRIIAATNADLRQLVHNRLFRQDLLYRLNVLSVNLPPLRERVGDIALLARNFVERLCRQYGQRSKYLHPSALLEIERRPWPGNVRELENVLHQSFLLSEDDAVRLPPAEVATTERRRVTADRRLGIATTDLRTAKRQLIADFERRYLQAVLQAAGGNVSVAARLAGKERRALGKLIKRYGLKAGDRTADAPAPV